MLKPQTFHITTFGCQMNERDSETLAGLLGELGYRPEAERNRAEIILMNTCSVRDHADKRFFGMLGQLKHLKENEPGRIVGVCGCMAQQEPIVEALKRKYPWVDLIFGTQNLDEFPGLLRQAQGRRGILVRTYADRPNIVEGLPADRRYPFKAYINIMFGCDNFCTYCIVPYTRGREKSRSPQAILEEARRLAESGTKEITLLGQNVNSYSGDGGVTFAGLLRELDRIPGIERIRFMTSHPKDLSDELIEAFRTARALCPHLHLPVQAGSNAVLARMNRKYTRETYLELVGRIRQAVPAISLTTDVIVGFPGETEADFLETLDLMERVRFASAFTFLYSPRQGTPAAAMTDVVPEAARRERFDRLVRVVNDISFTENQKQIGKTVAILTEGTSKTDRRTLTGRTPDHRLVNFTVAEDDAGGANPPDAQRPERPTTPPVNAASEGSATVRPGDIVRVRITEANTFSLKGRRED